MQLTHLVIAALAQSLTVTVKADQVPILPSVSTDATTTPAVAIPGFNLTHLTYHTHSRTRTTRSHTLRLTIAHDASSPSSNTNTDNADPDWHPMFPALSLSHNKPPQPRLIQIPLKEPYCGADGCCPRNAPKCAFAETVVVTDLGRPGSTGGVQALVVVENFLEVDLPGERESSMRGEVTVVVHDRRAGSWVGGVYALNWFRGGELAGRVGVGGDSVAVEGMGQVKARELWVTKAMGRPVARAY